MTMPFILDTEQRSEVHVPSSAPVRLMSSYPRLGDTLPDFEANSTIGDLQFYDWAQGHWTLLFSHPCAFSSVCTTEILALSEARYEFQSRNLRPLALSTSPLQDQIAWHRSIEESFDVKVTLPSIADPSGGLCEVLGMLNDSSPNAQAIRKTYILDPQFQVRMIFEYPAAIGRGIDEVLRAVDALQAHDRTGVATPSDWHSGDDYLLPPELRTQLDDVDMLRYVERVTPYLSVVKRALDPHHCGVSRLDRVTP